MSGELGHDDIIPLIGGDRSLDFMGARKLGKPFLLSSVFVSTQCNVQVEFPQKHILRHSSECK